MRASFLLLSVLIIPPVTAGAVSVPNTFQPNTPALASEVNANFDALVLAVNALQAQVDAQAATISTLQAELATAEATISTLQSNSVLALDGFLFLDMDAEGNDVARFDQVNVQITNGLGATNGNPMGDPALPGPVNGLGNLIVGYNEATGLGQPACANGAFDTQFSCEASSAIWAREQRTGSHNLVIGIGQFYSSHGGLLAGRLNIVNREWSSVSGGFENIARGIGSSISGGSQNIASGGESSVSGGRLNWARGDSSAVGGGQGNSSFGFSSSVSGGFNNNASGDSSSVSGGGNSVETTDLGWCASGQSGTTPCD